MRDKSREMRGVSGTGVSNGYGERQYEGGVRTNSVYVCCTVYSSMYLYGKNICVNVCECVEAQWSEA